MFNRVVFLKSIHKKERENEESKRFIFLRCFADARRIYVFGLLRRQRR